MSATTSSQVTHPDYDELRALYVKGVSLKDLAARFNVSYVALRSRSSREQWGQCCATARNMVTQRATEDLQASVGSWIGKIDKFAHRTIDSIIRRDPDSLKVQDLQALVATAKTLADVFRPNAGLDAKGEGKTLVQIAVSAQSVDAHPMSVVDIDEVRDAPTDVK